MRKSKVFRGRKFPVAAVREAIDLILKTWGAANGTNSDGPPYLRIYRENETLHHDDVEEFFSDYSSAHLRSSLGIYLKCDIGSDTEKLELDVYFDTSYSEISVRASQRAVIERILSHFDSWVDRSEKVEAREPAPTIFIGHGGASHWRDLKDHLRDKHGMDVIAYETGARAGHTIRDILHDLTESSSFALLVMSAEDRQEGGGLRARQNVVHEIGLFQGRLGFSRAVVLVEEGAEVFSNLDGIQQIRFSKGNIKETFGDVLATIRREFAL